MQDDEIDLLELFKTLWEGKILILLATFVALMCGYGYVFVKSQSPYSVLSQVDLEVLEMPAGFSNAEVEISFERAFFSAQSLKSFADVGDLKSLNWKPDPDFRSVSSNSKVLIFGDDLIPIAVADDFKISVWSKNPQVPLMIEAYARAVADEVSSEYVAKVLSRRGRVAEEFSKLVALPEVAAQQIIAADDFFEKVSGGSYMIRILPPTELKSTVKRDLILALSVVLGGFLGCAFVLLRHAIRARRPATDVETPN